MKKDWDYDMGKINHSLSMKEASDISMVPLNNPHIHSKDIHKQRKILWYEIRYFYRNICSINYQIYMFLHKATMSISYSFMRFNQQNQHTWHDDILLEI